MNVDPCRMQVFLPKPDDCPRELYDLMRECWRRDERDRPSFREIRMFLQRKSLGYKPPSELHDPTLSNVQNTSNPNDVEDVVLNLDASAAELSSQLLDLASAHAKLTVLAIGFERNDDDMLTDLPGSADGGENAESNLFQ